MTTKRFAIDRNNNKFFIGSTVKYKSELYSVHEIDYLSWNTNQYLTLVSIKNKNKKLQYISPNEVKVVYRL